MVAAIIGIFVEMFVVAMPLFLPSKAVPATVLPAAGTPLQALVVDDYATHVVGINRLGALQAQSLDPAAAPMTTVAVEGMPEVTAPPAYVRAVGHSAFDLWWNDGRFVRIPLRFRATWTEAAGQTVGFEPGTPLVVETPFRAVTGPRSAAVSPDESRLVLAAAGEAGIELLRRTRSENFLGEVDEAGDHVTVVVEAGPPAALLLDGTGRTLFVGRADGVVERWEVGDVGASPRRLDAVQPVDDGRRVAALGFALGDVSLLVSDERGGRTVSFPVRDEGVGERQMRRIRDLAPADSPIVEWYHSLRDRTVAALTADGRVLFDHATTGRGLLELDAGERLVTGSLNGRGTAFAGLGESGRMHVWAIANRHPEISFSALFSKIWYEGYDEPAWVWQSTAATSEFEPKLSLVPLIFGTAKATFYAMLLSLPLALLAAVYASQFMGPRTRRVVKPAVEIMAAFPTVVIGFLAALWLAPRLEYNLVGFYLTLAIVPIVTAVWLWFWETRLRTPRRMRGFLGFEWLLVVPVLALGVGLALALGPVVERALFDGNVRQWLFSELGTRYDQRNSIAIAVALGFAVVPIIFTIADDAMSNVPKSLTAASLAVGATRWQTVWKVILPSASPGIFAAFMIGFGRAVGETMIVLMATGNTPIMDWSWFNGMRTLSANIAVEIPEAPHGGSLYRVLFLSAILLFVVTFIANTLAEVVRTRLRQRYGRF